MPGRPQHTDEVALKFFASCGKGLEYLLADELVALGCVRATAAIAGAITHGQGEKIAARTILNANATVAAILPLRLIAPFSRHATI